MLSIHSFQRVYIYACTIADPLLPGTGCQKYIDFGCIGVFSASDPDSAPVVPWAGMAGRALGGGLGKPRSSAETGADLRAQESRLRLPHTHEPIMLPTYRYAYLPRLPRVAPDCIEQPA